MVWKRVSKVGRGTRTVQVSTCNQLLQLYRFFHIVIVSDIRYGAT